MPFLLVLVLLLSTTSVGAFRTTTTTMPSLSYSYRTTTLYSAIQPSDGEKNGKRKPSRKERRQPHRRQAAAHNVTNNGAVDMMQRLTQLEEMAARQAVEIKRLQDENKSLRDAVDAFAGVVELLREAGLSATSQKDLGRSAQDTTSSSNNAITPPRPPLVGSLEDDHEIFGKAPSSVMDAADAAGAAVLAGLLAGQRRLLVDVRDAELNDPETLVQFLELAVLPVAAGLEGLRSKRNRLKIVFPRVAQLLEYRKTMALAAPEVVALSTMDLDPIQAQDNLVVVLAPHPDDSEGVQAMQALLDPKSGITQPVVVLNPHMAPISGPAADFMVAYQLRLFAVHYMAKPPPSDDESKDSQKRKNRQDQLEAAMQHARDLSRNPMEHGGTTRAMVIRAYPNPWNVFVDTSPDTDTDFVVAGTFVDEPTAEDVNMAIIECLEGSEEEDELVAQQMQQALESGQLDRVSELLGDLGLDIFDEDDDDEEDDDDDEDLWRLQDVDTV